MSETGTPHASGSPRHPPLEPPGGSKPKRREPLNLPYGAAASIGAAAGLCYGLVDLVEGGIADGGLWFLLIGPVGGALVGIQLAMRCHWADRGPEWNHAHRMVAFLVVSLAGGAYAAWRAPHNRGPRV